MLIPLHDIFLVLALKFGKWQLYAKPSLKGDIIIDENVWSF